MPDNAEDEFFGAVQGETLTAAILRLGLNWNGAFDGKAIFTPDQGPLTQVTLGSGMRLTLLSPTIEGLAGLKAKWEQEVREANLDPNFGMAVNDEQEEEEEEEAFAAEDLPDVDALAETDFEDDNSVANASSIAVLAEFDGKRALFSADAPVETLRPALERFSPGERLSLDLFKISHHGSKNTTSRELLEKIDCPIYVFSTNGSIFKHPHHETVARVIMAGGDQRHLVFNYRTQRNEIWDLNLLKERHDCTTTYPTNNEEGIEIEL